MTDCYCLTLFNVTWGIAVNEKKHKLYFYITLFKISKSSFRLPKIHLLICTQKMVVPYLSLIKVCFTVGCRLRISVRTTRTLTFATWSIRHTFRCPRPGTRVRVLASGRSTDAGGQWETKTSSSIPRYNIYHNTKKYCIALISIRCF